MEMLDKNGKARLCLYRLLADKLNLDLTYLYRLLVALRLNNLILDRLLVEVLFADVLNLTYL
jgi:hypothetical protein